MRDPTGDSLYYPVIQGVQPLPALPPPRDRLRCIEHADQRTGAGRRRVAAAVLAARRRPRSRLRPGRGLGARRAARRVTAAHDDLAADVLRDLPRAAHLAASLRAE